MTHTTSSTRPADAYSIDAVDRALRVVDELSRVRHLRVLDVAEMLSISMSSAHRLLATLVTRGYAAHAPTGRSYVPGPQLVELAERSMALFDLKERAALTLKFLSDDIDETLHFAVLQGISVRFIDAVEGRVKPASCTRRGLLLPASATAAGKALLAPMCNDQLRDMHPRGLFPLTERGLSSVDDLLVELDDVRRSGFALNREESELGVTGIAVRAQGPRGRSAGAIVVTAPSERLCASRVPGIVSRLRRAAVVMESTAG